MSDWNQGSRSWYPHQNSFAYSEDQRGPYSTAQTSFYPNQQYVGFNEFISQIQQNGSYSAGVYEPHQTYPPSAFNNMVDSNISHNLNQTAPTTYTQLPSHTPETNMALQYNSNASLLRADSAPFTSNLTPTAIEFVPKNAHPQHAPPAAESSTANKSGGAGRSQKPNKGVAAKAKNEVHQASGESSTSKITINGSTTNNSEPTVERESKRKENSKGNTSKNKKKQPTKAPTTEDVGRTFYNSAVSKSSGSQDIRARNQDVRYSDNHNRDNYDRDNYRRDVYSNNYGRDNTTRDNYGRDSARDNPNRDNAGREIYNRDGRDNNTRESRDNQARDSRDNNTRDNRANQSRDSRDNQSRDSRDNQSRDSRDNKSRDSRENHTRDSRDNPSQDSRDIHSRDSRDNQSRDSRDNKSRDSRENHTRDSRDNPSQDSRDIHSRDSRDNQSRDLRENHHRDSRDHGRDIRENVGGEVSRDNGNRDNNSRNYYSRDSNRDNYSQDNGRDFYSRDSYNRESYGRNRHGTHRANRMERTADEDEQYANNYLTYREERQDSRRPVTSEKLQLVPASPARQKSTYKPRPSEKEENSELTQRERLGEQLDRGVLECLVCCDRVKQPDAVWSCGNCYHVLHLWCIRKWATSSLVEGKWRCPACQNTSEEVPAEYLCFCGAMRAPDWVRGSAGAHSCGERCRRARACPHPCPLPCHPGPCPACQATLNKKCGCGEETRAVVCSSKLEQVCGRVCGRRLACGVHFCTLSCHEGECEPCKETLTQVCHCPAGKSRVVQCSAEAGGALAWACGDACGRVLACGAHVCRAACHAPPCQPCRLLPEAVLTCPCGKMTLSEKEKRTACTDPIPLCGNICASTLTCGPPNDPHFCKLECHDGPCPPCPDKTLMTCRCTHTSREVDCVDVPRMTGNIFCTKKCNKKLSCGRHRCRELCCALDSHRCPQVCGRTLSCGLHRCDNFCHTGHCPGCGRLGFTELRCECGAAVLLPPVACGARPPACAAPCTRARPCGHEPHHACHGGECPPCVVLTTKRCHGGHEERKTIPCHQEEFSCGLPCGKPLPCGKHTCNKVCHTGDCATTKCVQQCAEKRPGCGHPCGAPCHAAADEPTPCPAAAPCRLAVRATCPCGRRFTEKSCADNAKDFARVMSTLMASKMQEGSAVDLSDVTRPGANLKTLECDDECRVEARTRQMALVLQIRNPDTSSKLAPRYSEHVRQWAARDPSFSALVHARLTELVQLAKKSKQKTRSHSFPSMNRQKRQFVHELCEHFGCESVAYDAEPNRNVVATADREKSWLPAMSVLEVLEREAGKRRVPGPVLRPAAPAASAAAGASFAAAAAAAPAHSAPQTLSSKASGWATLTSRNSSGGSAWGARPAASPRPAPATPRPAPSAAPAAPARRPPPIDYFDNPPTN